MCDNNVQKPNTIEFVPGLKKYKMKSPLPKLEVLGITLDETDLSSDALVKVSRNNLSAACVMEPASSVCPYEGLI